MALDFRHSCMKWTVRIHLRMKKLEAAEDLTEGTPETWNTTQIRTTKPGKGMLKDQKKTSPRRIKSPR